jgi:hypothetical protein
MATDANHTPIVDRHGKPAAMEDFFHGGHVFLVCGGPSINALDLPRLNERGIVTFGINNVSAHVRTNLWTFGDKPCKFHDAIWFDPGITKFVPQPKINNRREANQIRRKTGPTEFTSTDKLAIDCPAVFGLKRNSTFDVANWLWQDTINWGNGKDGAEKNKLPRVINTMFQAVRLCYFLGFRTVYLLGADFRMDEAHRYAFGERRTEGAIRGNNAAYEKLDWYFTQLRPWFDDARFTVLNCNPDSHLTAFEFIDYESAIRLAQADMPEEIDTYGWYQGFEQVEEDD